MSDTPLTSNELDAREKRRLSKKARKLSKVFGEEFDKMEGDAGPALLHRSLSSPSGGDGVGEKMQLAKTGSLPQIQESLTQGTKDGERRSSWLSVHSLLAAANSSSWKFLEAGNSSALSSTSSLSPLTAEQPRRGKGSKAVRQLGENIPPDLIAQSVKDDSTSAPLARRRQSFDVGSRASSTTPELKRSNSLWAHQQARQGVSDDAAEFQDRYLRNFGTGNSMTEHQRNLNVKRARKMAQLFGQEPPSELIQIHDEREFDHFRDSTATLSTFMAPTPPPLFRDRANSTSSTGTVPNEVDAGDELPHTPPPFATAHLIDDAESSVSPDSTKANFQDRRRRAAKLSRFFGVGFQEISPDTIAPALPPTQVGVDIKVSGRRFWGFHDRSKDTDMQDTDMQEAIQRLRGLRAS
ncbi:hypothetical protein B0H10DRAFT_428106 [Mycena sp. CBHHK59/15]|nr:hypothetical protein B0H10DRAFT_428106 [Mycena sp. CBHHK59/15]